MSAKSIVDCRVVTGGITECNPYGSKFVRAKKIKDTLDRHKLIVVKTQQIPAKKPSMRVISVADMIERYVKVEDSLRFKGSEEKGLKATEFKEPVPEVVVEKEIEEIKRTEQAEAKNQEIEQSEVKEEVKEVTIEYGQYTVVKGDALSRIAKKFGLKTKELAKLNGFKKKSTIRIGQKLKIPLSQKMVDAIVKAEYKVESGDTLISIAKKFGLSLKDLAKFNHIKRSSLIRKGEKLLLPLPHKLAEIEAERMRKIFRRGFGKHRLRVTATAYTSHKGQTDKTPFLAAWNNRLRPGMKIIAVSRDLLSRYGMRNGTVVKIAGLSGYYRVRDKMNKRYKKRIDIYMGLNKRKALRWGRRSVMIYW